MHVYVSERERERKRDRKIIEFFFSDLSANNLCGTIPVSGPFEHFPMKRLWNKMIFPTFFC